MNLIMLVVGMIAGTVITWSVVEPMKSWHEGYEAAKKTYDNWDKGFSVGFDAARDHYTDYAQGYYDGWKRATEQEDTE